MPHIRADRLPGPLQDLDVLALGEPRKESRNAPGLTEDAGESQLVVRLDALGWQEQHLALGQGPLQLGATVVAELVTEVDAL